MLLNSWHGDLIGMPHCRKEECEMCQAEKKANKRWLQDLNSPASKCHLDMLTESLPFLLAQSFGYHDEENPTTCSCRNKQDPGSHKPIQLPLALGEVSKIYLGSGVDECLANLLRLNNALVVKWGMRFPRTKWKS